MPIIQDASFTQVEVLKPMLMTDTQKTLVGNIIDNITADTAALSTLKTESQAKFNEVIQSVNDLKAGTDTDITALEDNINAILFLESEAGNDSFTGLFTKLFSAINDRKETIAFTTAVTSSPNGQVVLDLAGYEFSEVSEYELQVAITTDASGRNLEATAKKISKTQAIVSIRDNDRLSFAENAESFYDAAVKGEIELVTIVVRTAKPITGHLTSVGGVESHLGHDASDHELLMTDVTGTFTVNGGDITVQLAADERFNGKSVRIMIQGEKQDDPNLAPEAIAHTFADIILDSNTVNGTTETVADASRFDLSSLSNITAVSIGITGTRLTLA